MRIGGYLHARVLWKMEQTRVELPLARRDTCTHAYMITPARKIQHAPSAERASLCTYGRDTQACAQHFHSVKKSLQKSVEVTRALPFVIANRAELRV